MELKHSEVTDKIIKAFYEVYNELGSGFLESVYESALTIALNDFGLIVERQKELPVFFRGQNLGLFRADLVVNHKVILELKTVRTIAPEHEAQLLNYLKATDIEVGLLFNFGPKPTFKRFVFGNSRKKIRVEPRESGVS